MALRWNIAQAAEIRWWKSYLSNKPVDDYLAWKAQYWRDFILKTDIDLSRYQHILDAGCGPAGIFTVLETHDVIAIDPLMDKYSMEIDHFRPSDYPWTQFQTQALERLDQKETFDTVFCLNAINHVSDIEISMDRLVSSLVPGGQLVLSIDAHNYQFWKYLFRVLPGDILHPHQYSLKEYQQMLSDRGLRLRSTTLVKSEYFFDYYAIVANK